jgi:DNA-binding ferritin-like protein (Dps family)
MKKLLKTYGFNSDMQYFEMIAESFLNGQISQAINQFKAMPKAYRISMVKAISNYYWQTAITSSQRDLLFDNI